MELLKQTIAVEPKWIQSLWSAVERLSIESEAAWPTQDLMEQLIEVSVEAIHVSSVSSDL